MKIEGIIQAPQAGRQLTILLIYGTYEAAYNTYKLPACSDSPTVQ